MHRQLNRRSSQRGAATLVTVLGLTAACAVGLGFMARALGTEHRGLSDRWPWAVAREAAESGQHWARAQLHAGRLDSRCQPSALPAHSPWVDLRSTGTVSLGEASRLGQTPSGLASPLASCQHTGTAWQCQCTHDAVTGISGASTPAPSATTGYEAASATPGPAVAMPARFEVALQPASTPHTLIVHTWGCASPQASCSSSEPGLLHRAYVQTSLGFVPHLRVLPNAALTVHGHIRWPGAPTSIHHAQGTAGATLVRAAGSWLSTAQPSASGSTPEVPPQVSTLDRWLQAAATGDAALSRWLGARTAALLQSGQVQRLDCAASECAQRLQAAWSEQPDTTWWIDNTLIVQEPLALGSAQHPLLLIINGDVHLQAAGARLQGVVIVRAPTATLQGPGSLEGAMVVLGDAQVAASAPAPTLVFNPEVVQRVRERHGLWVPIPGSWRDY